MRVAIWAMLHMLFWYLVAEALEASDAGPWAAGLVGQGFALLSLIVLLAATR